MHALTLILSEGGGVGVNLASIFFGGHIFKLHYMQCLKICKDILVNYGIFNPQRNFQCTQI